MLEVKKNSLTETRNPRTIYIDRVSTREAIKYFIREDALVAKAVEACQESIAQAINLVVASFKQGGRLIYMGAGTSGRLGILDASECPPTFGVSPNMVIGLIAGGDKAIKYAVEGAEDDLELAKRDLESVELSKKDAVVGISASGTTPYVKSGLDFASSVGAKTVLLTCNPYGELPKSDVLINPVSGPEVICGSTRLKSGTACKMVLNMISSISMTKIGKVYENLMVDMVATNEKLRQRALKIVIDGGRVPNYMAEAKLKEAEGDVKLAIIMARTNLSLDAAKRRLKEAHGIVYKALGETDQE